MMLKLCPKCGVRIGLEKSHCEACLVLIDVATKERHRAYRARRTDGKYQRVYQLKAWKEVRKPQALARDFYCCVVCMDRKRKAVEAQTVHHIVEVKEDIEQALNLDNLASLCESCHQLVHKVYLKSEKEKEKMQKKLKSLVSKTY